MCDPWELVDKPGEMYPLYLSFSLPAKAVVDPAFPRVGSFAVDAERPVCSWLFAAEA